MATNFWRGGATAVKQVANTQITAFDAATTYRVTIGDAFIEVLGDTDEDTTASNLKAALSASNNVFFKAIVWTAVSDTITGTALVAGVEFVFSTSVAGGAGTISAYAVTVVSAGPNDWSTANNWSLGAVPVNSDDVIIADGSVPIRSGLDQSAITLASLRVRQSYTGQIGLVYDQFIRESDGFGNSDPDTHDYRLTHLTIDSTNVDLGENFGPVAANGSQLINIDLGGGASTIVVHDTGPTGISERNAFNLLCANASTNLFVHGARGGVGLAAMKPGETSTIGLVSVDGNAQVDTKVQVSDGVTLTTWTQTGGTNTLNSAGTIATVSVLGGTLWTHGDFTITTGNALGGTWFANHVGSPAFTTLNIDGLTATVDALSNSETRTWTTVNYKRGNLIADDSVVTITTLNEGTKSRPYQMTIQEV